jgi:CRISPR-associated protein Cmr2
MSHLVIIALGPVQDFIASARRCQDLWFGSYLLSELARATAQGLSREALIFPDAESAWRSRRERAEVANKVVAVIDEDVDAATARARDSMQRRLEALMNEAFRDVPDTSFRRAVAEAQVRELIEFVWVAVPIAPGDEGYRQARAEAERLLAARKNSRRWGQPPWGASNGQGVPKSSLDGLRESVIDESLYPRPGERDTPALAEKRRRCGIEGMERLDGVGLLKRLGRRGDALPNEGSRRRFASTSHLAALPWMLALDACSDRVAPAWSRYCDALDAISPEILETANVVHACDARMFGRVDGQVFFEGRLLELLEECGRSDRESTQRARKALARFLSEVRRREPQPYYAILHADGDRMGRVIDHHGRDAHRRLSQALVAFASRVYDTVRAHHGSLVYSGGDDVLALLPLHRAIACADALRRDFAQAVKDFPDATGNTSTLSAGLAIVHHLTPFDVALDVARRAEKDAKQSGGNTLTLLVDKRGGAEQRVSGSWDELIPMLDHLIELHRSGVVSAKFGYELSGLARLTDGVTGDALVTLGRIARATAMQLFDAKRVKGGSAPLGDAVRKLLEPFSHDAPLTDTSATAQRNFAEAIQVLGDRLVLAQQLARVADEASPPEAVSLQPSQEVLP